MLENVVQQRRDAMFCARVDACSAWPSANLPLAHIFASPRTASGSRAQRLRLRRPLGAILGQTY